MSNFDYFKQYQSEMERIKNRIAEEENPHHKAHIAEFSEMIDERIQAVVPQMIQEQQEDIRVNIQAYMNGRQINNNKDFMKGVKDAIMRVLNGKGR